MSWTEDKVKKLKELYNKGSTASQIAEIIGGKSRNACNWEGQQTQIIIKNKG